MFVRRSNDVFDMERPVLKDDSVRDFQYYSYDARTPNQRGRIELQVPDTSRYFLPEAFIEVEGSLTRADNNAAHAGGTKIGIFNNGIMAFFKSAIYMIDGKEIETIHDNVDVATTIIGLARFSDDYTRSAGPSMVFAKDTTDHADNDLYSKYSMLADSFAVTVNKIPGTPDKLAAVTALISASNSNLNLGFTSRRLMVNAQGRFSCVIPLSHMFGFCRDVRKVVFGGKHKVLLHKKAKDNDAIWRANGVTAGQVELTKLSLWMPVITPSISEEQKLLSFMDTGGKSLLSWGTTTTDVIQGDHGGLFTWHIYLQQGVSAARHSLLHFKIVQN